LLELDLYPTWN